MTGRPVAAPPTDEPSRIAAEGWHCLHAYYRFDRALMAAMSEDALAHGRACFERSLGGDASIAPQQLQTGIVMGHKADFSLMALDPDPLKINAVHQSLLRGRLSPAIAATYSFVSMTEVSEYVPSVEQYAARLTAEGESPENEAYQAKLKAYQSREPMMRRQRLTPELPTWPSMCFYPMNKKRKVGENWFTLSFDQRNRMMAEHARSGMEFAGRVTQLITVGVGLEDWEWGVTLWARNPAYLKDIVYRMRFDEASARYAEFGPFYTTYLATPAEILKHALG